MPYDQILKLKQNANLVNLVGNLEKLMDSDLYEENVSEKFCYESGTIEAPATSVIKGRPRVNQKNNITFTSMLKQAQQLKNVNNKTPNLAVKPQKCGIFVNFGNYKEGEYDGDYRISIYPMESTIVFEYLENSITSSKINELLKPYVKKGGGVAHAELSLGVRYVGIDPAVTNEHFDFVFQKL